ncbi:hypothetical protein [Streptomyces sp. NPDC093591]|uniref:hypothetical protein n=1 Tax=Streptomyces sp. NPDC093591 TaxID=3366044 RepID=UPI0037FAE5E5
MVSESSRYFSRPLIIRGNPDEAEEQVERAAESLGWPCRGEIPADPDQGVPYEVQWMAGPALILHFVVDDLSNCSVVRVSGDSPDFVESAAFLVKGSVDVYSFEELLDSVEAAEDTEKSAQALMQASVGAPPEFSERLFGSIRSFLASGNPELQEAAIWATSFTPFAQYRALLNEVLATQSDLRLRKTAMSVLEAYDHEGVPEQ